ncbi:lipopolysaccharide export system permease protein LptG [Variibacter gotjawalensis]|uniref:Lipopolysaccharide export system permease protein LptG n=1 Tax=Variibacter gotjawalensis TaxID=1333996 RepID=A0A0S3PYW4_9BRAD|nr:LPS export ABC transporter permease LptG [Variibacter gotjawalensis]NIK46797.1 lipopolysaccharide export system permease protein [Variibacter gotjawalensis]RZS48701.1 lipopolysaccharide export system permease protein [Variibacter gotjawalensis]BAT60960.1 lipopolysaccharide export system permease protein LptG [Variibacter gotjawalensis]
MIAKTFGRYVAKRFVLAVLGVFVGMFFLVVLLDYIEMMRKTAPIPNLPTWLVAVTSLYRVPQITERMLPFSVLVGAMVAYLNLSRRNELVIARAAGISAWQFVAPAVAAALVLGIIATAVYNPIAAYTGDQAKRFEEQIFGPKGDSATQGGYWVRQRTGEGQSVLFAANSRDQGAELNGVSIFVYNRDGAFLERVEADKAAFEPGRWKLTNARIYAPDLRPRFVESHAVATNLSTAEIQTTFATPNTVPFWRLPAYIELAEQAGLVAAGYRLQYQLLLAKPFLLAGMVMLAAAVSLRFFRMGGVQKMVLSGVAAGFLLYVLSKITEDLAKAELLHSVTAAWSPVAIGMMTGVVTLLFQEDG